MKRASATLALALAAAWLTGAPVGGQEAAFDAAAVRAGHDRMVAELREIQEGKALWNPYFRSRRLDGLRRAVAQLPPDAPMEQRLGLRFELGMEEFRLGSIDAAIEQLSRVLDEVPPERKAARSKASFYLGLAFFRLGERQNCVANHTGESCLLPIRGGGIHTAKENARRALAGFRELLTIAPPNSVEHLAVRWLMTIAYMALGEYPEGAPPEERLEPQVFAAEESFPTLQNIAPRLGLDVVDFAGGAVVEDLDGDDLLDVLTSSWAPSTPLRLFLNQGDGSFREAGPEAGLAGLTGGLNLNHADYDNDGDFDLLVLRGAWLGPNGRHPNSLLRNDGRGRFTDVTFLAGLGEDHRPTQAAAWADYDNDGDLDLYIGNEGSEQEFPAQLFRNQGDGTFVDVALAAGVENRGFAKAVSWGDYDGDRYPDLYVSNYRGPNRLYRNNRDGTFTDVAERLQVTAPTHAFATWFWDFDNDGALDIYASSYPYAVNAGLYNLFAVVASMLGIETDFERSRLYRGDGEGGFEEVGLERNLKRITMPMGANFGDLDNDGYLDFYLGTGYPEYDGLIPNLLYRNDRGRRFLDVTTAAGVGHLQKGHGVVFADLDNDGDQDLFEQVGGFFSGDSFANALFENPGFGRRWLSVRLVGERSNRSAVGARIRAEIVDGGDRRSIHRVVGTGGSFGSDPLREHLGLGDAERVEVLEIYWPTSDTRQRFEAVAANQAIEIREGAAEYRPLSLPRLRLAGETGHRGHAGPGR